ncbi:hypothetical protein GY45DRAFT_363316 [Cubamyces sp. BRFM 1775]|nr:hypothetical protein GY45DRAFT_363316 [Cubamyces sp. BRFM 1775]
MVNVPHIVSRDDNSGGNDIKHQLLDTSIISFHIESILFGAFAIAYTVGVCLLLRFGRPGKPSTRDWALYLVSTTMFLLALAHVHLSARLVLYESVYHADTPRSPFNFWYGGGRYSTAMFVAKYGIYVTQTLIGDVFMSYRLFIVWNRQKYILIVPAFLVAVSIGSGYSCMARQNLLGAWATVFFVTSFANNVYCSALIMWRILSPSDPMSYGSTSGAGCVAAPHDGLEGDGCHSEFDGGILPCVNITRDNPTP